MNSLSKELVEQLSEHKKTVKVLREYLSDTQLEEIKSQLKRLEEMTLNISIFGETNSGKSALPTLCLVIVIMNQLHVHLV